MPLQSFWALEAEFQVGEVTWPKAMIQDAECIFHLDGRYKSKQQLQFWQVEQCAHNCIDVIITPTSINTIPIRVTGAHP